MADAALFIGWGTVVRGREQKAIDVFNESVQYWGGLQGDGSIESFEVALLNPHGGDLAGYALLRGDGDKLDEVRRSEGFRRVVTRANLIVESLGVVPALIGNGVAEQLTMAQEQISELA